MTRYLTILLTLLAAQTASAQHLPDNPVARAIVGAYADACATETGSPDMTFEPGAFVPVDLDEDPATEDMVVDMRFATCDRLPALFSGSGGSPIHLIVGEDTAEFFGGHWQIVDFGDDGFRSRIFLLGVHGLYCDGYGSQLCVRAIGYADGVFSTQPVLE
ncbi:hypothetical protein [Jannaschia marina]|uniref:hypothetical protein n=1 Tax=Jannaschia marina TaxID=2741674 RepID=UPI0015CCD7C7|nr:hypothetical protein [Jannaschia marina]